MIAIDSLSTLTKEKIEELELANVLIDYGNELALYHEYTQAKDFINFFDEIFPELFEKGPTTPLEKRYHQLLQLLLYVTLSMAANDQEVIDIFEHNLFGVLSSDEPLRQP